MTEETKEAILTQTKEIATNIKRATNNSLLSTLLVIFLTLKLTGVISWSWWWVLAPLWGGILFSLFVLLLILLIVMFIYLINEKQNK